MNSSSDRYQEQPGAYFVQGQSHQDKLTRVLLQDRMVTAGMGGVLAEQANPTRFQRILDVGCGTGGWLAETARTYPEISELVGIDISKRAVSYARMQAAHHVLGQRIAFYRMDALRLLEFPAHSFDLINERLGVSYLRTWDWAKLLSEFRYLARPEGVIRLTEGETITESSSLALLQLNDLLVRALHQAGHYFTPENRGVTRKLEDLLQKYGFQNIQSHTVTLEYRAGTVQGQHMYENTMDFFRRAVPFLRKWVRLPENYEDIYQQMVSEMQQPDFVASWKLLTVWGQNPLR